MRIYISGCEHPTWRRKLTGWGAKHVAINFKNLIPRLPKKGPFLIAERFPDDVRVVAHFLAEGMEQHIETYLDWVEVNAERLDFAVEPDGAGNVEAIRSESPCIPIWRPEDGHRALNRLTDTYSGIAVLQSAWKSDRPVEGRLNRVAQQGTHVHGLGVSKREILEGTLLASCSTGSWLSVTRQGETQIWDGSQLRRFPATDKSARERYRAHIARSGMDPEAIAAGDRDELVRLALWSWQQFEDRLSRRREVDDSIPIGRVEELAANSAENEDGGKRQVAVRDAANSGMERATKGPTREPVLLPIMEIVEHNETDVEGASHKIPVMRMATTSLRQCDNCQLSEVCPEFSGGQTCAFSMPITIRTKDQLVATLSSLLEMQGQRVLLARFREELEGSVDKTLSDELDRMFRMTEKYKDIVENPETFKMQIEAKGGAGVLSRLFGARVGDAAKALPGGGFDEHQTDVVIAEVVEEDAVVVPGVSS
jgi:hypothetical protein